MFKKGGWKTALTNVVVGTVPAGDISIGPGLQLGVAERSGTAVIRGVGFDNFIGR